MVGGDIALKAVSSESAAGCPFHGPSSAVFDDWLDRGLQCSAGKREFKLGRYFLSRFRDGSEFGKALEQFKSEVAEYRKTGFLALFSHDESQCQTSEDELWLLGAAMHEAGLAESAADLIKGGTLASPVKVACPVTGVETTYEFFSVAFTRHAGDPGERLYDPSLGAPFTAINTTSDAFAFAMLVRDLSVKAWGKAPYEVTDRHAVEHLFRRCTTVWQNMSINTIQSYNRVSVDPARAVHLAEDRRRWIAPHNDPVFAELTKESYIHEMPVIYAARLCAKWSATLFDGKPYVPARDGQSGGVSMFPIEKLSEELAAA